MPDLCWEIRSVMVCTASKLDTNSFEYSWINSFVFGAQQQHATATNNKQHATETRQQPEQCGSSARVRVKHGRFVLLPAGFSLVVWARMCVLLYPRLALALPYRKRRRAGKVPRVHACGQSIERGTVCAARGLHLLCHVYASWGVRAEKRKKPNWPPLPWY